MRQYFVAVFFVALLASVCIVPTTSAATMHVSPEKITKPIVKTLDSSGSVGNYSSIAIGRDGYPVISYKDSTSNIFKFAKCNDAICSSATIRTIDSSANVGDDSDIAIGRDGFPVMSYHDLTGNDLEFAKCNDASCSSVTLRTLESSGGVGYSTSIAIGSDGYPVISYRDGGSLDLKMAKCNNTSCSSVSLTQVDTTSDMGLYSSIAIGRDGYPVISYYANGPAYDLKFAKCHDLACTSNTISTLDSTGDVGYDTSIDIGRDGYPVIAYYSVTNNDLKFIKCNDAGCSSPTIRVVDSVGGVGYDPSITIGRDGYPVMTYYDSANMVKFAKCMDTSCASAIIRRYDVPGASPSIAIGRDGYPIISIGEQTTYDLKTLYVGAQVKARAPKKNPQLVGYWNFNEGTSTRADDISGNKNHGTLTNGPTWATGRSGRGIFFNYDWPTIISQVVSIPSAASIDILPQRTISIWFRPLSVGVSGTVLSKGNGWTLGYWGENLRFTEYFTNTNGEWGIVYPTFNAWHHIVVAYDNSSTSNVPAIYLDGRIMSLNTMASPVGTSVSNTAGETLTIGNNMGSSRPFHGSIDEVRIYNGILSASDIQKLYQEKATVVGATQSSVIPSGLVGYWSFNGPDISGSTAYDRSGQGNNGLLNAFSLGYTKLKGGKIGQGMLVGSASGYLNAFSPASLDDIHQLTFSTWLKLDKNQSPRGTFGIRGIAGKGNFSMEYGWGFCVSTCFFTPGEYGRLEFYRFFSGTDGTWRTSTSTRVYGENEWAHVAFTYNDTSTTNDPTIYINGEPVSVVETSTPTGTAVADNSFDFHAGDIPFGESLRGKMDEVRVYNRILTASEIKALYNAGK